jgi:YnbE-like lipoprotein
MKRRSAMFLAPLVGMMAAGLGGCVQIETPDKPIEINLNINIRQEVVFRLDGKAKELVEQNSEIF